VKLSGADLRGAKLCGTGLMEEDLEAQGALFDEDVEF